MKAISSSNTPLVYLLKEDLHQGEAETIALAVELNTDVVFLDESEARRISGIYNLKKSGVIGILIRAKRERKISSLGEESC